VQAAKDKTNEVLAAGSEPQLELEGSVDELLAQAEDGDYVCVQAFVQPTDENDRRIGDLVRKLGRRTGLVVTHGYGPRYLHSTGQLHKGGPNTGLFLQIVDDPGEELAIPGKPFGFRRLFRAQAAGDFASLKERGRRVARIHIEDS
jgi:transaldolase / glucose-6-phosphate isomerase